MPTSDYLQPNPYGGSQGQPFIQYLQARRPGGSQTQKRQEQSSFGVPVQAPQQSQQRQQEPQNMNAAATGGIAPAAPQPQYQSQQLGAQQPAAGITRQSYKNLPTQQPKDLNSAFTAIRDTYTQLMGRQPTQPELDAWGAGMLYGNTNIQDMLSMVQGFPESQARSQQGIYGGYNFNQSPLPTYQPGQINVNAPGPMNNPILQNLYNQQSGTTQTQTDLLNRILSNPETMSPKAVSQLKGSQQEQALAMQKQLQDNMLQQGASRGLDMGSGQIAGGQRRIGEATQRDLLNSYRDIDLEKIERDRADQLAALGAADSTLGNQLDRAGKVGQFDLQQYLANLDRTRLDADVQAKNLDESFRGYQTQADARKFGFGVDQAQADDARARAQSGAQAYEFDQGMRLDQDQLGFQKWLGEQGLGLDYMQFLEGQRQFDKGLAQDDKQFGAGQSQNQKQFLDQMGLNWAQLNSSNQNNYLSYLLGNTR